MRIFCNSPKLVFRRVCHVQMQSSPALKPSQSTSERVYSCFYDLASAFDTVEYAVLLHHLYKAGVVGKTWRLIKNWYSNSSSCVTISDTSSRAFPISRGVKQGSVLSSVLFLFVMDTILLALKNKPWGLNICGLYLGAFCHADDIRTLVSSKSDCSHHISSVEDFASSIGSQAKCWKVSRCLGALWTPDLSCSTWMTLTSRSPDSKISTSVTVSGDGSLAGKVTTGG